MVAIQYIMENTDSRVERRTHDFDQDVHEVVEVDPKHYKFFFRRRAQPIKKISRENGGVSITFPRKSSNSNKVVLTGAKNFVDTAKLAITQVVTDLESQVVVQCIIPFIHHRTVKGLKGVNVKHLTREHNVWIQFPFWRANSVEDTKTGSGSGGYNEASANEDPTNRLDLVLITGKEEDCLKAKEALLDLVPSNIAVNVPSRFHGLIVGRRGRNINPLSDYFGVRIQVPSAEQDEDWLRVRGPMHDCEKATVALLKRVEELQAKDKARKLRRCGESSQVSSENKSVQEENAVDVEVPSRFHHEIIGERYENILSICDQFRVYILTPHPDLKKDLFRVLGPASICEKTKKTLGSRVKELLDEEDTELRNHRETVRVSPRYHPYIFGHRGATVTKISLEHDVSIHFPHLNSLNSDQITVVGYASKVRAAIQEILNVVEEVEEVSVQVDIANSLHAGLVETKGEFLSKIVNNCNVVVYFPLEHGSNKVIITGTKKNVEVAKALLFVLALNSMVDVRV